MMLRSCLSTLSLSYSKIRWISSKTIITFSLPRAAISAGAASTCSSSRLAGLVRLTPNVTLGFPSSSIVTDGVSCPKNSLAAFNTCSAVLPIDSAIAFAVTVAKETAPSQRGLLGRVQFGNREVLPHLGPKFFSNARPGHGAPTPSASTS